MNRRALSLLCLVAGAASTLAASGGVLLRNDFIEQVRNRVTITADFKVDEVKAQPNTIGDSTHDGDLHMAGRSDLIGLPMVAELSNGRLTSVKAVETAIHNAQSQDATVQLSGVWRVWMEHKSTDPMQQGLPVPPPGKTNPLHVFEIHPITAFSGTAVLETFVPLKDDAHPDRQYQASDAAAAFPRFDKAKLVVDRSASTTFTALDGPQTPYNYVEFFAEIAGAPTVVGDGVFAMANVLDLSKHSQSAAPKRMVLVKDSRPAAVMAAAAVGTQFRVLGIPRINLDLVMRSVDAGQKKIVTAAWEMIVLAVIE